MRDHEDNVKYYALEGAVQNVMFWCMVQSCYVFGKCSYHRRVLATEKIIQETKLADTIESKNVRLLSGCAHNDRSMCGILLAHKYWVVGWL